MSNVSFAYNVEDSALCKCDDCGHVCPVSALDDICDVQERLDPGGVVPAGQCPECGALSYLVNDPYQATRESVLSHAYVKALADIALLFHGVLVVTLNARAIEAVAVLQRVGFCKIVSGLVIITERSHP
jgi:hypothetical protein